MTKFTRATWAEQNAQGRGAARDLIKRMIEQDNPLLLGRVLQALFTDGAEVGVRVGFTHELADNLIRTHLR